MSKRYLIDSNCFITAKNTYYPFDFAPSFWSQLENHLRTGKIVLHQAVLNEVKKGQDDLSDWIQKITIHTVLKTEDALSE